jgi:hypothetical protein
VRTHSQELARIRIQNEEEKPRVKEVFWFGHFRYIIHTRTHTHTVTHTHVCVLVSVVIHTKGGDAVPDRF